MAVGLWRDCRDWESGYLGGCWEGGRHGKEPKKRIEDVQIKRIEDVLGSQDVSGNTSNSS